MTYFTNNRNVQRTMKYLSMYLISKIFLKIHLHILERERESVSGEGAERENLGQTPH